MEASFSSSSSTTTTNSNNSNSSHNALAAAAATAATPNAKRLEQEVDELLLTTVPEEYDADELYCVQTALGRCFLKALLKVGPPPALRILSTPRRSGWTESSARDFGASLRLAVAAAAEATEVSNTPSDEVTKKKNGDVRSARMHGCVSSYSQIGRLTHLRTEAGSQLDYWCSPVVSEAAETRRQMRAEDLGFTLIRPTISLSSSVRQQSVHIDDEVEVVCVQKADSTGSRKRKRSVV